MKLKHSRWMAGVCLLSGGFCVSLPAAAPTSAGPSSPEAIKDFHYTLSTAAPASTPVTAPLVVDTSDPELAAAASLPATRMNSLKVRGSGLSDRDYRELSQEVSRRPLTAARAFFTANLGNGAQLEAIGAPLYPMDGENATHQTQARFPIFGVNW